MQVLPSRLSVMACTDATALKQSNGAAKQLLLCLFAVEFLRALGLSTQKLLILPT